MLNIYEGDFFCQNSRRFLAVKYFQKNIPSLMSDRVLNTPVENQAKIINSLTKHKT